MTGGAPVIGRVARLLHRHLAQTPFARDHAEGLGVRTTDATQFSKAALPPFVLMGLLAGSATGA
jgi:hypothetical protein